MKKRILTLFLAICMICTLLPFGAFAAEVKSGTCGPNATWTHKDGVLTISGTGEIKIKEDDWFHCDVNDSEILSIVINNGITAIGDETFFGCLAVKNISIPNSVKKIGNMAFMHDEALENINIPNSVTNIGELALCACLSLKSIDIPNSVTSIGPYAFWGCSALESISIPNNVKSIGEMTFSDCTALKSVSIPKSLTSIGENAFENDNSLKDIYYEGTEAQWTKLLKSAADGNSPLWNATVHYNSAYGFKYEQIKMTNYVPTTANNQQFVSCASNTGIVIPGLSKSDGMIPQGLAYWKAKGWFIISSYSTKNEESIISVIDSATGKLVRQFSLSGCKSHVGGIAVSDCNLYVATGSGIGYIPLSTIENQLSSGATGRLSFSDTDSTKLLGDAEISYMSSYKDPSTNRYCLLIGNFYYANSKYNTPASSSANSVICSLKLDSDSMNGSADEWRNLRNNIKSPKFTINLAKDIDRVQYAVFNPANNKLYLSRSWTRNINSSSYISAIDVYNFNGTSCTLKTNQKQTTLKDLPMSEGICLVGNYLYNLFESGADKYANGSDGSGRCQYPSDTIWRIDLNKLQTVKSSVTKFSDVLTNAYYAPAVLWAVENNITNGVDAAHFAPNNDCTRGQIVTFLWRAKGCPSVSGVKNPFKDVKSSDYYYKAVLWAVSEGITTGVDKTHFAPNNTCTRAQSVTFMWRAEGQPGVKDVKNPFVDVKSSDYYYKAVLWAVKNGITTGIDANHFAPNNTCTRGQIVTFLYRDLK